MGEVRFMISEAAKQVAVESHVLRYWEEELDLKIGRTEMGHRYYTKEDIQLFCCIKKLKDEGMLLKDLKPLIPELTKTRMKLKAAETEKEEIATGSALPASAVSTSTAAEVIPITQLEQVRSLIGDVLTDVVSANNETLKKEISRSVTTDVIREMDFLFQAKERQEEEHFRKLDCLIRQQQANRKEAVKINPLMKFKKMLT
ncbi:helix-turn-helix domain-containing protein [Faecalicatena acetigenes]|uniref:Helix-turn-helix domain-containing protein n=1 Tax=Faecalicatena acetigenes TaxID=2981790 RepID=A0ABT2TAB4_9FIRM|nr:MULTISPECIES: helix-turn-helix domain-containing protein [Lachnospiraceae]MCU6746817.1 helix-turn-helix domain-containing protein [Faecalicatena acetigenes]SCH45821.1 zinc-responsive transcriptional regulator [uncultured Clostridium sp.]